MGELMNTTAPWYERRAPERLEWYPAWCTGYAPPVQAKPRSWRIPGLLLAGLIMAALASLAMWFL
jgi:hypothetical protein